MKCTLRTETLAFWRLKVPSSDFSLPFTVHAIVLPLIHGYAPFQAPLDTCLFPFAHASFGHEPSLDSLDPLCLLNRQTLLCQALKSRFALQGIPALWEGKAGSICHFAFPLFCSVWGSQDTQMLGNTARKMPLSHPLLVCPKC